ncbi:MAG TPA: DUF4440 domain-containing protein [Steroidobacteraceae bacterium]|jgi:hypothetical protein|nr:DUF4440 domain-containing protein [Steroidobacteraceae bacterium]
MELASTTDPKLLDVLAELRQREPIFHRPEFGTTRAELEAMVDDDFWEVGASGRRYTRKSTLEVLEKRIRTPDEELWETTDFRCQELAAEIYLLTYTLRQGERITRRSTIWRRSTDGWKIVFHQGTIVASAP